MTALFADTFYCLALLNPDDRAHDRAIEAARSVTGPKVTTTWVMTEVADALAAPELRGLFGPFINALWADPTVTVVAANEDLFRRSVVLYAERNDKGWSLTDCISFVVMTDRGLTEALTADRHFVQAGFRALLG